MTLQRMDNILINVEDMEAAKAFFTELGMKLEGETTVEGPWADRVVGLEGVRADIAMMVTPDGHGRVELSTFERPVSATPPPRAPVNVPGIPRLTFLVDDVDEIFGRLQGHGGTLVGEIAEYEDIYRYAYVRGPAGVIVGICQELQRA